MSKENKNQWQVTYWAIFLGLSLVLGVKILEMSAEKKLEIILLTPAGSQYSTLR